MIDSENSPDQMHTTPIACQQHGKLVGVGAGAVTLDGILSYPADAHGLVLLAHGLKHIGQNTHQQTLALVALLNQNKLATLLVDLFNSEERKLDEGTAFFRENIEIMHQRFLGMADWLLENPETQNLTIGLLGADVVGAAALVAAAERPDAIAAIVTAAGRADMIQSYLPRVTTPTLLIAAEKDEANLQTNQDALKLLPAQKQLESIADASSLFENAQVINEVAHLAEQWFSRWLKPII